MGSDPFPREIHIFRREHESFIRFCILSSIVAIFSGADVPDSDGDRFLLPINRPPPKTMALTCSINDLIPREKLVEALPTQQTTEPTAEIGEFIEAEGWLIRVNCWIGLALYSEGSDPVTFPSAIHAGEKHISRQELPTQLPKSLNGFI